MKTKTEKFDYLHQFQSRYNRQSGEKTLIFVGILIVLVVVLTVTTLLLFKY